MTCTVPKTQRKHRDQVRHYRVGWEPPPWRETEDAEVLLHLDREQLEEVLRWNERRDDEE